MSDDHQQCIANMNRATTCEIKWLLAKAAICALLELAQAIRSLKKDH